MCSLLLRIVSAVWCD
ncbi:hypothetical protein ACFH3Z_004486 [Escherichia coli]|nr:MULTISPECIES: hypothetical protein [Escherichia]MCM4908553.1 hypothetical protein [Escherichia coli]MCN5642686.1 hypothetical protein [Escherichia coli]MCN6919088.1 hypothetical protein [Escherichia coli]MCO1133020.1 hypothetical protein [Escherichia coli]MCV3070108.1 hypothetical protein [Escherichia coli]